MYKNSSQSARETRPNVRRGAFDRPVGREKLSTVPGREAQETENMLTGGGDIGVFLEASAVRDDSLQASSSLKQTCTEDCLQISMPKLTK